MDTTKTNIKMCEKAEEVQELWKPSEGDCCVEIGYPDFPLFLLESVRGWGFITAVNFGDDDPLVQEDSIWLPHQAQLQEMLEPLYHPNVRGDRLTRCSVMLRDIYEFSEYDGINNLNLDTSMEQLWLAFVMKSLYQKSWDGENWVKEGSK